MKRKRKKKEVFVADVIKRSFQKNGFIRTEIKTEASMRMTRNENGFFFVEKEKK